MHFVNVVKQKWRKGVGGEEEERKRREEEERIKREREEQAERKRRELEEQDRELQVATYLLYVYNVLFLECCY